MARKDFIKQLALQLMRDALNMRNQAKNLSRDLQVLIQKHAGTSSLKKMESNVQIPKFDGKNFASWKFRIISILEGKELDAILEADPPKEEEKFKEWKKRTHKPKVFLPVL
ncbi:hypothetical protein LAZ67_3001210 [Cordylochernes scorpioides]|uniref:Uncharacterized protein n=1 Tax=Cordylochernes scorpioides TaxID=51811 RepID=A0ABY6K6S9_9ARAC|nr:hypothetical protein LAZ67_3001210 [Cordylochernes scorpioides]